MAVKDLLILLSGLDAVGRSSQHYVRYSQYHVPADRENLASLQVVELLSFPWWNITSLSLLLGQV